MNNVPPSPNHPATPTLSAHEAIEQGIEAAKSGNRLLARWQLEGAAAGDNVRPEVWMWLAWVAESPVKAQGYLKHVVNDSRYGHAAKGGLDWLSVLTGEATPHSVTAPTINNATSNTDAQVAPKAMSGQQSDESVVHCPSCEAILFVRSSAIGRPRLCPACDSRFLVELDRFGKVQARILLRGPNTATANDGEFASPVTTNAPPQTTNGETVLVVDDSPTIRRVASMILNKNGYKVITATNGEDGFSAAVTNLPSLVLLDINMPGIGGYETCKRLRANPTTHHIPIVMLSGNDGLFDQVKGYQAGSSKYLTKPCDASAMLTTVRQLLSRPVAMKS